MFLALPCNGAFTSETVRRTHFDTVSVTEVTGAVSFSSIKTPQHFVFMPTTEAVSNDNWEGKQIPTRIWKVGEVAFLPANSELHSASLRPFSSTAVRISDHWFREFAKGEMNFDQLDFRYLGISTGPTPAITAAMKILAFMSGRLPWPSVTEALALSLAAAIAFALGGDDLEKVYKSCGLSRERKARVLEFIYVNLGRQISLAELAGVAALSPYHFSRAFKNSLGVSPIRYLLNKRIRRAKRLLSGTITPLVVIASMCGFASQSHLGTAFQFATGKSPGAWRKASS